MAVPPNVIATGTVRALSGGAFTWSRSRQENPTTKPLEPEEEVHETHQSQWRRASAPGGDTV
jgi:hypothetical protein